MGIWQSISRAPQGRIVCTITGTTPHDTATSATIAGATDTTARTGGKEEEAHATENDD